MKVAHLLYAFLLLFFSVNTFAQADTAVAKAQASYGHRDSLYAAKINYTGNLMIGGGIGLVGAGTYLIYQGVATYKTPAAPSSSDPTGDINRNHKQGTGYIAGGILAYIGSGVLIGLGAKNKIEFKRLKKRMSAETGLLKSGNLGFALNF